MNVDWLWFAGAMRGDLDVHLLVRTAVYIAQAWNAHQDNVSVFTAL